jgi:hypothetical protein
VTTVLARYVALFPADLVVFVMQGIGLPLLFTLSPTFPNGEMN